ncbi:MAG TPA: MBL fold metallo-hydrolase, partial [Jatrophihabitans sp.]|nr:MBL fold metallo-hydrolase [Jatrophihabitans sp.]
MTDPASAQDRRLRRPAVLRTLQLGDATVSFVPDGAVQLRPRGWLPDTTEETWAAHPQYLDGSGNLVGSIGGLLVERAGRALLIDAGFGPQAWPAEPDNAYGAISGGALLDNLAKLGRRPADIDAIAFTHLHIEHVGWAWHPGPNGAPPVFMHADYLVTEPEWAQRALLAEWGTSKEVLAALAPRIRLMRDGQEIFPGVRVRVT